MAVLCGQSLDVQEIATKMNNMRKMNNRNLWSARIFYYYWTNVFRIIGRAHWKEFEH